MIINYGLHLNNEFSVIHNSINIRPILPLHIRWSRDPPARRGIHRSTAGRSLLWPPGPLRGDMAEHVLGY